MKLVYGIGLNDAGYQVRIVINGVVVLCKFYSTWAEMLKRCYSEKYRAKRPSYEGCTVCADWLYFSKFREWMMNQDWNNKQLDKDILIKGNKIYGPDTCSFVSSEVNSFVVDSFKARGDFPIGVTVEPKTGGFVSRVRMGNGIKYLGIFRTPGAAHEAWRKAKHSRALELADKETDQRVANALRARYGANDAIHV